MNAFNDHMVGSIKLIFHLPCKNICYLIFVLQYIDFILFIENKLFTYIIYPAYSFPISEALTEIRHHPFGHCGV